MVPALEFLVSGQHLLQSLGEADSLLDHQALRSKLDLVIRADVGDGADSLRAKAHDRYSLLYVFGKFLRSSEGIVKEELALARQNFPGPHGFVEPFIRILGGNVVSQSDPPLARQLGRCVIVERAVLYGLVRAGVFALPSPGLLRSLPRQISVA